MSGPLVLVTGATGYLGSHVVVAFLAKGYRVRGTVRDPNDSKKTGHLKAFIDAGKPLELVAADLTNSDSWAQAMSGGVELVAHVASPFVIGVPDSQAEERLIKPAVQGTLAVLKAAADAGVKKVVLTSSVAAVSEGRTDLELSVHPQPITEEEWTNVDAASAYPRSKTLAEKAAWEFIKSDAAKGLQLAVINPGFIIGPTLSGNDATSMDVAVKLLTRAIPAVPDLRFSCVDVRDVARAHVLALEKPEAMGKRMICIAGPFPFSGMASALSAVFAPLGYNVPTGRLPFIALWFASFFDRQLGGTLGMIGKEHRYDNSLIKSTLGLSFIPCEESIVEMGHSAIKHGLVKPTAKYTAATATSK